MESRSKKTFWDYLAIVIAIPVTILGIVAVSLRIEGDWKLIAWVLGTILFVGLIAWLVGCQKEKNK